MNSQAEDNSLAVIGTGADDDAARIYAMARRWGQLDQISSEIGGLKAVTERLTQLFDRHCDDDRRMHDANSKIMAEVRDIVLPLKASVEALQPVVASLTVTRWKTAGAWGVLLAIMTAIGWGVEAFGSWAIDKLLHHG